MPVAVTEAKTDELTPAQKKQIEIAKAKAAVLADAKAEDTAAPMETTDDGLGSDSDDDKPIVEIGRASCRERV